MFSERAGCYTHNHSDDYHSSYYTFTPHPLCRDISLTIDDELIGILANTHRLLGLLEGLCRNISDIENITRLFQLKEAATSYCIDDNLNFTYPELFGLYRDKKREQRIVPVRNHIKALEYGVSELNHIPLANKLIYATHGILMDHKRKMELIGAIRKKQTIIGDFMIHVANMKSYNPTEPEEIKACMADVQEYIKRKDAIDPLIKMALLHYQVEAIHPFESGNGRIGRIIVAQYLCATGLLKSTLLPISEFLLMDKVEYFDRLDAIHHHGRYEQWIKFFLRVLEATADKAILSVEVAVKQRSQNLEAIKKENKDVAYLLDAYKQVERHIFLNTASLAVAIGVSYNTSARIMDKLVSMGIMKLIKSQARNRIYFYADFLDAVEIEIQSACSG